MEEQGLSANQNRTSHRQIDYIESALAADVYRCTDTVELRDRKLHSSTLHTTNLSVVTYMVNIKGTSSGSPQTMPPVIMVRTSVTRTGRFIL